jgi:hypothetical protein
LLFIFGTVGTWQRTVSWLLPAPPSRCDSGIGFYIGSVQATVDSRRSRPINFGFGGLSKDAIVAWGFINLAKPKLDFGLENTYNISYE